MGRVDIVAVRPSWRRRGIARALLHHGFSALYRFGKTRAGLEVDAESSTGATRLYEQVGMRVAQRHDFFELELRPGPVTEAS